MALFSRSKKRIRTSELRKVVSTIQATLPEGVSSKVMLESMLTATNIGASVPGTTNAYKNYTAQVTEIYKKYNAYTDFGNQQTRAIVDLRTALIAGEGISVSAANKATSDWIESFLDSNNLQGENFINAVKGSEMAGQSLIVLKDIQAVDGVSIKVSRFPYRPDMPYEVVYKDAIMQDEIAHIKVKRDGVWQIIPIDNFVYIRTGGDDSNMYGPTPKVGIVLTDIENYDRAIRDSRRLNHVLARITPNFKTATSSETKSTLAELQGAKWKIGDAVIGTSEFSYATPGSGAHNNLLMEEVSTIKSISAVTGVPVHWLGYVDLMSNRSTADSLYELIKHATILERASWEKGMYDVILLAQEMYIDSGGTGISIDNAFEVKLPLIDFSNFFDKVKALSLAFSDEAISMADYRNALPGINPIKTAETVEMENKENENRLVKAGIQIVEEGV